MMIESLCELSPKVFQKTAPDLSWKQE